MPNQNTIQLTLTVKDDGTVVVQQFGKNAEDALGKVTTAAPKTASSLDIMSSAWVKAGLAIGAVEYGVAKVQQAMQFLNEGAKAAQAETSFRALAATANESADRIIAAMKRASAGTIDTYQMEQKATKAMMLDFSGDQITKMMEMARQGARMTGEDVGQVFDKITDAISTNMPRALRQYGLITKEQQNIVNQAMAEGVADIDLLSIATSNYALQQSRLGPLLDDSAEKLQANRARWQEYKESLSQFLYNTGIPVLEWLEKVSPLARAIQFTSIHSPESTPAGAQSAADVAAAEKMAKNYNDQLKASLGLVVQKKADLESMKALDKDYLKSQEDNIKYIVALMTAAGGDEFKINSDSLQKTEALNAEYYTRTANEIKLEAEARSK
ncbi:MAG: hypothetical protein ABSC54_00875, partial [Smithellaceae bacterium]